MGSTSSSSVPALGMTVLANMPNTSSTVQERTPGQVTPTWAAWKGRVSRWVLPGASLRRTWVCGVSGVA